MQPSDDAVQALALCEEVAGEAVEPIDGAIVRVLPIRASPPDPALLVMLGGTRAEAPAALRVLRHRLELRRAAGMWTFAVTSARGQEGKTTLAAQLALVLGEAERARVLLVEGSLDRPALARLLGVDVPQGLGFSAQMARRMRGVGGPWAVLALHPSVHALLEDPGEAGYPAVLHAPVFRRAVDELARAYDWVIVDAPSILGSGDAHVVEEVVDGVIVVARSRRSRATDLRAAMKQLGTRKAVGVVLWDAPPGGARS